MSPRYLAAIFDFDGTLADSYAAIAASVNHVRALHGLAALSVSEVKVHVGRGPDHLLAKTVPHGDVHTNVATYKAHHPSVLREGTYLLPGVQVMLSSLQQREIVMSVCSNKPRAFTMKLTKILEIEHFFQCVLGPEDAARPKPAPDMLLAAIGRIGIPRERCVYVGDMTVDIETANAAGVAVYAIATGSDSLQSLEASKPTGILRHIEELVGIIG